ncbi:MAG: tripartite tricarboxylate transporter substrate binding protein [Pseudomonadota bacterium]
MTPCVPFVPAQRRVLALAAFAACLALSTPLSQAQAWKPEKTVEIVVGSAAGGGNDKTARVIQKVWTDTKLLNGVVSNKVGGGGAIAYGYVSAKDDPHFIGVAQAGLITNHITGRSPIDLSSVTPLAYMGSEAVALTVRADSPIKDLKQFQEQLKKDPTSLSISVGSTLGGTNHFAVALIAKAAGVDPKKLKLLVFGGGAESVTNLLGGHISAMSQLVNNSIPHHKAKTMRILCVTTTKRLGVLPDVPTCTEQGANVVLGGWTVIVGPKKMTPAQVTGWEDILQKTAQHPDWKGYLEANSWDPDFKKSGETAAFLKADYEETRAILTELGLAKQ